MDTSTPTFTYSKEEREAILAKLADPFPVNEIKWRVTATNKDKTKGRVVPYADKRSYTDRLTQLFTVAGWSSQLAISTLSPIQREKKNTLITTGKVMGTSTVTIQGLGTHSSSGEEWADDENATTRVEAQAFKRACSEFGLGRYLYNIPEMWVPINQYREIVKTPDLPAWAKPGATQQRPTAAAQKPAQAAPAQQPAAQRQAAPAARPAQPPTNTPPQGPNGPNGGGQPRPAARPAAATAFGRPQQTRPATNNTRPVANQRSGQFVLPPAINDAQLRAQIAQYSAILGHGLYSNIVAGVADMIKTGKLAGDLGASILQYLQKAETGITKIRGLAGMMPEQTFYNIMDSHQVEALDAIPTFNTLAAIVRDMEAAAEENTAAAA